MTSKTTFVALFTISVLLLGAVAGPLNLLQSADALKGQGVSSSKYGSATKSKVCGDKLCSEVRADKMKQEDKKKEQIKTEKKAEEVKKAEQVPPKDTKAQTMEQAKQQAAATSKVPKTITGSIVSKQDPGLGHESHQLAVILPPSDKIYRGHITYSASENVQLVALNGPLLEGKDKGQATWTTDGKTKYGLTLVDNENSAGVWQFTGNALAVHTKNTTPFTVTYSVTYTENVVDNQKIFRGTMTSVQDPGIGHESHQLAVLLPPSDKIYRGHITYDASEPIQLVTLIGPLKEGELAGQPTWTTDGITKYALVFVDPKKSAGSWVFSGNALAIHTKNTDPFTVSYAIVLTE
jgi:hypothetical protein